MCEFAVSLRRFAGIPLPKQSNFIHRNHFVKALYVAAESDACVLRTTCRVFMQPPSASYLIGFYVLNCPNKIF